MKHFFITTYYQYTLIKITAQQNVTYRFGVTYFTKKRPVECTMPEVRRTVGDKL